MSCVTEELNVLNKVAKIGLWALGIAVFAVLLTVGGFFDLQISQALYNENSLFGWFFAYLGDGIGYFMMLIAMVILLNCTDRRGAKPYLWWIAAAGVFAAVFVNVFWFSEALFIKIAHTWVYVAAIALFFTPIIIWLTDKIDKNLMKKLALFALFIIIVVAVSQCFTQGLKVIWCRLRFRNMVDGAGFTPWWQPNLTTEGREYLVAAGSYLPDDAFKSFPSGHTSSAGTLFSLIILPYIFKDEMPKWGVACCYVVPWLVTAIVALSRIVNGAHFLSDVTFGALSAVFAACLAKPIIIDIKENRLKRKASEE